jgi:sigma-B regulation protein RsbQ
MLQKSGEKMGSIETRGQAAWLVESAKLSPGCRRHRVTVAGDGPVLVLQHGFGTDQAVWDKVRPSLTGRFCVVRMDLAGAGSHGAGTFDAGQYDHIDAYADDLLLVMQELGIAECLFAGTSVGCMVGLLAAIARPRAFRKLVCLAASPHYLNDGEYVGGFEQEDLDGLFDTMHRDFQGWISGFAPLAVRGLPDSAAVKEFSASLFSYRPDIALSMARTIFLSDFRRHLGLVETPTVLLQTLNDIAVPMEVGEYMQRHIRHSTLEVLPVQGHFPQLADPEVVSEALLKHLQ